MRKRYLIVFLCLGFNSFAQHAVELDSKSLLIPRYTNLNEITNAITSPKQGMLVFNQSTGSNWQYNGFTWSNTAGSVSFPIIHSGNTSNPVGVLELSQTGTGSTSIFKISNNSNSADAVYAESNGSGNAIHGVATNNAVAGFFENGDLESSKAQLVTYNVGLGHAFLSQAAGLAGSAGRFENNPNNNASLIYGDNYGTASSLSLTNHLSNGTNPVIWASQNGLGHGIDLNMSNILNPSAVFKGITSGTGNVADFQVNNALSTNHGVNILTNASGHGLFSQSTGSGNSIYGFKTGQIGRAGNFEIGNATNGSEVLRAYHFGLGSAGVFEIDRTSNSSIALRTETKGTGSAFLARHSGSSGNIAIFQNNTTNVARIDKTGRGFFNGGTQSSGADLAEAFEVEGIRNSYEEGDILVISTTSDRKVEKSFEPYSNLVAGVYATKPGVLLTENEIDFPLFDHVPMGVIGVIPTKVCNEGGLIKRGDFIVSSSRKGFAMKV